MAELYPTKSRLALLQGVRDGEVAEYYGPEGYYAIWEHRESGQRRIVTSRTEEARREGWIWYGYAVENGKRQIRLTGEGVRVLEANR